MEATGEQPSRPLSVPASQLVAAARAQVGITTIYDPAFVKLAYPGGDLPRERGVCTDVIVRAYRDAFRIDLQQLVHADMLATFASYPPMWGLRAPDTSIDHRRVLNLKVFFSRKGRQLRVSRSPVDYAPGDLVTQELPGGLPHIAIVSDTRSRMERVHSSSITLVTARGSRTRCSPTALPAISAFSRLPMRWKTECKASALCGAPNAFGSTFRGRPKRLARSPHRQQTPPAPPRDEAHGL